jgi:purine nucleoside phosphorylase
MSTVPEVIAARHANFDIKGADDINYHNTNRMNILGLSVVTNLWMTRVSHLTPSHEEVKVAAKVAMPHSY